MGFKLAGVDPAKNMVAGNPASKVMLGTGSSAVQVWTALSWPQTGTWTGGTVPFSGNPVTNPLQVATFTIPENGNYTITWSVDFTTANLAHTRIRRDGNHLAQSVSYNSPNTATATWTGDCTTGQVIQFQAASSGEAGSVASGGTWTITKN